MKKGSNKGCPPPSVLRADRVGTSNLGFPRIGSGRELKRALESFWSGESGARELLAAARSIRASHWKLQRSCGTDWIPSNDFSLYDHMLDMICLVGAVPERFGFKGGTVDLATYFAMARGGAEKNGSGASPAHAMEMTKWLDTNYHYIVPEFWRGMGFALSSRKVFDEFVEAREHGIRTRPVLVGPVTFLMFGKVKGEPFDVSVLLDDLLPVYVQTLRELKALGADAVQIDEPALVLELTDPVRQMFRKAYEVLAREVPGLKICLTTYFESLDENLALAAELPVWALHVDLVRAPEQLGAVLRTLPEDRVISLGVVDGRNIWRTDVSQVLRNLREALSEHPGRSVLIAPSCSLMHVPIDLSTETDLDPEVRSWMAYAKQKLGEVSLIRAALTGGDRAAQEELDANRSAMDSRRKSSRTKIAWVRERAASVRSRDLTRAGAEQRRTLQRKLLKLPLFPTTTIGSFPQTKEVRQARSAFRSGEMAPDRYRAFIEDRIKEAVARQEELALDVLVHGEFERSDLVEYFGAQLEGFAFTKNGWVQSYGSRCVKPPVIFGDVWRPKPMTTDWFEFAQRQTRRPMKGMLTGPVTLLQWSFVRNDQPRSETARQIALAIRDEVSDLEKAGARIIQIDEAGFREGLSLKRSRWKEYLQWAVQAFRLCSSAVKDQTQIHTHMCYSECSDIIEAIADLNADVVSIETARSQTDLLDTFVRFRFPADVGPGVYDIHSPRVPSVAEVKMLLEQAVRVLPAANVWVNPDCGLKTRSWSEAVPALSNMVAAARELRSSIRRRRSRSTKPAADRSVTEIIRSL